MNKRCFLYLYVLFFCFVNIIFAQPDDWLGFLGVGAALPKDSDDVFVYTYGLNIRVSIGSFPIQPTLFLKNENNKETVIMLGLRAASFTIGFGPSFEDKLTSYRTHIEYELPWLVPYFKWHIAPVYEYIDYKDSDLRQKHIIMIQLLAD